MAWSVGITGEIGIDGDEGTIYLPPEVYTYMKDHNFSIICVKHSINKIETISVNADHYEENVTIHRR